MIGTLFFALNLAAALGLFLIQKWGFWVAYIAIIFSTIFFGTPYLPLISSISILLPANIRYVPMIVINLILLFCTAWLHISFRKVYKQKYP